MWPRLLKPVVSGVARGQLTPAEGQAVLRDAGGPAPRNRDAGPGATHPRSNGMLDDEGVEF